MSFKSIVEFLSSCDEIINIFDVDSLYEINHFCEARYNASLVCSFLSENLGQLMDEYILLSSREFYEDKELMHLISLVDSLFKQAPDTNFEDLIKDDVCEAAKCYVLILMFLCVSYLEINTKESSTLNSFISTYKKELNLDINFEHLFLFRGVTDITYDLIPSMYRNINDDYVHIDNKKIESLYLVNNSYTEYKKIIKNTSKADFYSYLQHSCAYSPLIDFTNEIMVAGSFAVQFTDSSTYIDKDAGIYFLVRDNIKRNNRTYPYNIEFFKKKLTPLTKIFGKKLLFSKIEDFYVKYTIIDAKSNDRMKYQDGLFLNIHKAVYVKNKLLFPNASSRLYFIRIPFEGKALNKDAVLRDIQSNYPHYAYDYLMDPYKWFSKRHK